MKPPDEVRRDLVCQWLEKAEEDFGVADLLLAENTPYLSAAGFHLQQAAEKSSKPCWSATRWTSPKPTTLESSWIC
ncbi:MAG: HEPN domain-containing protein [bacterium]|nr:HEPN domain-containing protein [bacterium]